MKLTSAGRELSKRSHHSALVSQLSFAESSADSSFVPVTDKHTAGKPA
jgi:hypothetical protein